MAIDGYLGFYTNRVANRTDQTHQVIDGAVVEHSSVGIAPLCARYVKIKFQGGTSFRLFFQFPWSFPEANSLLTGREKHTMPKQGVGILKTGWAGEWSKQTTSTRNCRLRCPAYLTTPAAA